ncbi:MAG TPA: 23S rRNA (adenine(1618)-N(6))-methyltransferase RlmF [Kiritimatiellia bacterium]|nr:23S rRNA (adenine(1618)-N(6))-methyltransferase RlmF [Kiritimatiellia bacterium]HMP33139.1 23S rRNA (adenine(1618)-N(6))-methyltransferase RlmF [Kiritimatiellia bacterium]
MPIHPGHHPRNLHRDGYDYTVLTARCPELAARVVEHVRGGPTIDFTDPESVRALNRALLLTGYGLDDWSLPPGALCPPVPGRADLIHHLADLLGPDAREAALLDIGTGASVIYPAIGAAAYGWRFVGTECDPAAAAWAGDLVARNPVLAGRVEIRRQPDPLQVFAGVTRPGERFAASLCNPPFFASEEEADAATRRKLRALGVSDAGPPARHFGGSAHELWCAGGEDGFLGRMIDESAARPRLCRWFTTLVSSDGRLPALRRRLVAAGAAEVRVIGWALGVKPTRLLAWTFEPAAT